MKNLDFEYHFNEIYTSRGDGFAWENYVFVDVDSSIHASTRNLTPGRRSPAITTVHACVYFSTGESGVGQVVLVYVRIAFVPLAIWLRYDRTTTYGCINIPLSRCRPRAD